MYIIPKIEALIIAQTALTATKITKIPISKHWINNLITPFNKAINLIITEANSNQKQKAIAINSAPVKTAEDKKEHKIVDINIIAVNIPPQHQTILAKKQVNIAKEQIHINTKIIAAPKQTNLRYTTSVIKCTVTVIAKGIIWQAQYTET